MIDFNKEDRWLREAEGRIANTKANLQREEEEVASATRRLHHAQDAQEILQHLVKAIQQQAHKQIAEVVTSCLNGVFEDPYKFEIEFERKRGRTEAILRFVRRNLNVDPLSSTGGGAVDVAAFALRCACLMLHRPRLSKLVVLDEPFRFVSAQYQDNIREMLEQLADDTGLQLVFVTHNPSLATGRVINLG